MSKTRLFAALAVVMLAAPAMAQQGATPPDGPVLFGHKDFEMEWKTEPNRLVLSARYLAAKGLMRLEILDGSARSVVRNIFTGDALYLVGQGLGAAYRYQLPPIGQFRPGSVGEMHEVGPEQCRDFEAGGATLCLTDDGIPLKITLPQGTLTASRLLRQVQHPALFDLPKGVEPKPLPPSVQPLPLPF